MYYIGLIIVALAVGTEFSAFVGWMVLGGGLVFAGLWNALFAKETAISDEESSVTLSNGSE